MSDFQVRLEEARRKLPLRELMTQFGDAPPNNHWKSFPKCPFCHHADSAGLHVKTKRAREKFKCFNDGCPTENQSLDEVAYLALKHGTSYGDASIAYLKMTGQWTESTRAPSVLPGQRRRKNPLPQGAPGTGGGDKSPAESGDESPHSKDSHSKDLPATNPVSHDASAGPSSEHAAYGSLGNLEHVPSTGGLATGAAPPMTPAEGTPNPTAGVSISRGGGDKSPAESGDKSPHSIEEPEQKTMREMAQDCLRWFYERLTLTSADLDELWSKRGLTPEECERAGLRSNEESNRAVLLALPERFAEDVLLASGLWMEKDGRLLPNQQFCGFGLIGKKPKEERRHDKDKTIWGWKRDGQCNPILIPYFDAGGALVHLRPHKGGIEGHPARLYVARNLGEKERKCRTAIITEGEFKARALRQVLSWQGGQVAIAALPGIQQAKNWVILQELEDWLDDIGAESVVVAYDSEDKSTPGLPGYQPDKRKRYDAAIWARYLAWHLNKSCAARVAVLPNEWRNARGKADWDGALAMLVGKAAGANPKPQPGYAGALRPGETPNPNNTQAIWERVANQVQAEFVRVIGQARPAKEVQQPDLEGIAGEAERIIQNGLEQLFYKRKLEHGGERELTLVKKLRKLAKGPLREDAYMVHQLADAYEGTHGWYYKCKRPQEAAQIHYNKQLKEALKEDNKERVWYFNLRLKGFPELVGNFRMSCKYVLVKASGGRDRLVSIRNDRGETTTALVSLDAHSRRTPTEFREWLGNHGNLTWHSGQTELDWLSKDLDHDGFDLQVYQVIAYGTHEETGIWFIDDVAFMPDGREILPDDDGIFWRDDPSGAHMGYQFKRDKSNCPVGNGDQRFSPSPPRMHPNQELRRKESSGGEAKYHLVTRQPSDNGVGLLEDSEVLREFFQELSARFFETLGWPDTEDGTFLSGYDGFVALGSMFSYFAAPEIFRQESMFPGLWVVGEQESGKNTLCALLVQFHGFPSVGCNQSLPGGSPAGLQITGDQYSNLVVWLDEYLDHKLDEHKKEIIHESVNRGVPRKWSPTGQSRSARTTFMVSGENRCSRGATRSRFPHIEISATNRRGDHLPWLLAHQEFFFSLGRYILRHRKEFVELTLAEYRSWFKDPALAKVETRARQANGFAYAAFVALARMLKSHPEDSPSPHVKSLGAFRRANIARCVKSAGEVREQVNVNELWRDIYNAWRNDAFGPSPSDVKKFFKAVRRGGFSHSPGMPNQTEYGWETIHLYVTPGPLLDALRTYKRRQGRDVPLSQGDLLAQMKTKPYFVDYKGKSWHKQWFYGGKSAENCWCINLDFHEMGYRQVPDDEWQEAVFRDKATGSMYARSEFPDPRKGDLFALVKALESEQGEVS